MQARPHVGEFGRDRIGQRQRGAAAAEQFGLAFGDERPGDRLDHAARGERALGLAGAVLDRRQHRLARVASPRGERRRRHAVDADDAHHLLDDVGLAVRRPAATTAPRPSRARPGRRRRSRAAPARGALRRAAASRPASRVNSLSGKSMTLPSAPRIAGDHDLGRRAAAEIEHHLRRQLEAGQHEVRIDAALEAIARVGIDAELAAGLRDVERRPTAPIRSARRWSSPSSRSPRRP